MMSIATAIARSLAVVLLAAGCSRVTIVEPEDPLEIHARPPAPPLPELPAVKQPPPPPPRVIVEADQLELDEAIGFDEEGTLSADHQDILAEVAKWMSENADVLVLAIEVQATGEGSRRARQKRAKAMAQQIVDELVRLGIAAERLEAVGIGELAEDGQLHLILRIRERAEASVVVEKAQ